MKRIHKVQKELTTSALIVQDPTDLFYLTGIELSAGTLILAKNRVELIVDGRYFEKCKALCPFTVHRHAPGLLTLLLKRYSQVGFDSDTTSYSAFTNLQNELSKCELIPLSKPIAKIRAIKEAKEVKALQKAADLCVKGFDFVVSRIKTGVTEKELAQALELFWLESGAQKLSFEPIIAFGKNSSMPHYRASNSVLLPRMPVLLDIGVVVDGYASDMTRVVFFGKPDPLLSKIYDIVSAAQEKAIRATKPGVQAKKLYEISSKVIEKAGYKEAFLHGLGHGLGLHVHEYPAVNQSSSAQLIAGMCITIEPGIYLPNKGGVRIEDMVLITKTGHKVLTNCPKQKLIIPAVG